APLKVLSVAVWPVCALLDASPAGQQVAERGLEPAPRFGRFEPVLRAQVVFSLAERSRRLPVSAKGVSRVVSCIPQTKKIAGCNHRRLSVLISQRLRALCRRSSFQMLIHLESGHSFFIPVRHRFSHQKMIEKFLHANRIVLLIGPLREAVIL